MGETMPGSVQEGEEPFVGKGNGQDAPGPEERKRPVKQCSAGNETHLGQSSQGMRQELLGSKNNTEFNLRRGLSTADLCGGNRLQIVPASDLLWGCKNQNLSIFNHTKFLRLSSNWNHLVYKKLPEAAAGSDLSVCVCVLH